MNLSDVSDTVELESLCIMSIIIKYEILAHNSSDIEINIIVYITVYYGLFIEAYLMLMYEYINMKKLFSC